MINNQINEYINSNIILNNFVLKRLLKESKNFSKNFNSLSIICENNENNINYKIFLTDNINYKYNNYCFVLNDKYPFISPQLYINNISYKHFLIGCSNNESTNYYKIFIKFTGLKCLCYNILSDNVWSPICTLTDIINEVNLYRKYKKYTIYKIIIDKIKDKYLNGINYIDIDSWLF
jgi:hypothetical protein